MHPFQTLPAKGSQSNHGSAHHFTYAHSHAFVVGSSYYGYTWLYIVSQVEEATSSKDATRWRPSLLGWRPSLLVTRSFLLTFINLCSQATVRK